MQESAESSLENGLEVDRRVRLEFWKVQNTTVLRLRKEMGVQPIIAQRTVKPGEAP
jgi:hypothetical protein